MKIEIEGHLGVVPEQECLMYRHPRGDCEVHIRNHFVDPLVTLTRVPLNHRLMMIETCRLAITGFLMR